MSSTVDFTSVVASASATGTAANTAGPSATMATSSSSSDSASEAAKAHIWKWALLVIVVALCLLVLAQVLVVRRRRRAMVRAHRKLLYGFYPDRLPRARDYVETPPPTPLSAKWFKQLWRKGSGGTKSRNATPTRSPASGREMTSRDAASRRQGAFSRTTTAWDRPPPLDDLDDFDYVDAATAAHLQSQLDDAGLVVAAPEHARHQAGMGQRRRSDRLSASSSSSPAAVLALAATRIEAQEREQQQRRRRQRASPRGRRAYDEEGAAFGLPMYTREASEGEKVLLQMEPATLDDEHPTQAETRRVNEELEAAEQRQGDEEQALPRPPPPAASR